MAKRFTDSQKWYDPWFRKLAIPHKLFWYFITDMCDHAGFWKVDFELASFLTGCALDEKETLLAINNGKNRVIVVKEGLWHVVPFVFFQYGKLNPNNNLHRSVVKRLKERGARQGLPRGPKRGCPALKDKDKDKDTDSIYNTIIEYWNSKVGRCSASKERLVKLKERCQDKLFREEYKKAIDKIAYSSFCKGGGNTGWKANIDWFIQNDTNIRKVLEGKYDDKDRSGIKKFMKEVKR